MDDTRPKCGGGGGGDDSETTAEYTAELTIGDFVFADGILTGLTANRKGTGLPGEFRLKMDSVGSDAWDYIFKYHCPDLVPDGVDSFDVLAGSWTINYTKQRGTPGNIHITMRNLVIYPPPSDVYSNTDFDFDLHGAVDPGVPFLPEIGTPSVFELTQYKLWAGAGGKGGFTCNSDGRPLVVPPSELVITRVE